MTRFLLVLGVGTLFGTAAFALDYANHGQICEAMEAARTHAWAKGEKEAFPAKCRCKMAEMERLLPPETFVMAVDWSIDARAFAQNLPEGVDPTAFMGEMISVGIKADQACK